MLETMILAMSTAGGEYKWGGGQQNENIEKES